MAIQRLFVTKRESFNQEAQRMLHTLQQELSMPVTGVTIYERYDIENLDAKDLESCKKPNFLRTSCGYSIRRNSSFARFRICC